MKKFTYKHINVWCEFITNENDKDLYGWYDDNSKNKHITINVYRIKKYYNGYNNDFLLEGIKETIIHELTHFFDYNFYKSWAYKNSDGHEHLANFVECFHEYLEGLSVEMLEYYKDKYLYLKENVDEKR